MVTIISLQKVSLVLPLLTVVDQIIDPSQPQVSNASRPFTQQTLTKSLRSARAFLGARTTKVNATHLCVQGVYSLGLGEEVRVL